MATTTSPAIPANAMTPAAWDTLNSDYATAYQNALKGGQTDATWAKSPEFLGFQNRTLEGVGNTYDTSKLQSDIASMSGGFDNPIYGDNFRKIVGAEQDRLGFLNGQNSIPAPVTTPMLSMQNYSPSSDPAYRNPLIAALRANSPAPARQAGGLKEYGVADFPWMKNTPEKTVATQPVTPPVVKPPVTQPVFTPPIPQYVAPPTGGTMDSGNWDSLNANYAQDYAKAHSGMTDAAWVATPAFQQYQNQVISGIGQTYDTDKLAKDIAWFANNMDDPALRDNYAKISAASQARLDYLNNQSTDY